jgi:hypothetical protein
MIARLVVSLCLALLAAAIPEVRTAVLDQIAAPEILPPDAYAGGPNAAARTFH